MTDIKGRYPLSTGDGKDIPLEVIRPTRLVMLGIVNNSPSTSFQLDTTAAIFSFFSDVDSVVKFAVSSAVAPTLAMATSLEDCLFIPANTMVIASPPIGKYNISVTSNKGSGRLVVQELETWSGLALASQYARR
jgi:hypothetical protein